MAWSGKGDVYAIVENRSKRRQVDFLVQGRYDTGKLEATKKLCGKQGIKVQEVAYIGDDLNCLDILNASGF